MRAVAGAAIEQFLGDLLADCRAITDGTVADYIPELAKADPSWCGIALATTDGYVYEVGDCDREFTIQSISKPFVYGAALDLLGVDAVLEHVGVEPTGNAFNAIAVDERTRRPFNPMVNAGAIVTTGLIPGDYLVDREHRIVDILSSFAGHDLDVDERVYESERSTGDRNRAMAYLMRSFDMLDDVSATLDLYFRQCSTLVTCRDLAVMAATLACSGVNPVTDERVLSVANVERVLSVMSSCGMYDFAGEWGFTVGLPSKSGVSGGVLAVLPGQLGLAVFSPPLDEHGNSVRGIHACTRISRELELHTQRPRPRVAHAIRRSYRGDEVRSLRVRPPSESAALDAEGRRIAVFELQGDLMFASAEQVHRLVVDTASDAEMVVFDLHRVRNVDDPGARILGALTQTLESRGSVIAFAHATPTDPRLVGVLDGTAVQCFDTTPAAIEWCEDRLLEAVQPTASGAALRDQPLLRGLDDDTLAAIHDVVLVRTFGTGEVVVREGEAADAIYFVLSGTVCVQLRLDDGSARQVAAFSSGMSFGESALLDERVRTADVVVEEPAEIAVLVLGDLDELLDSRPELAAQLYRNVAQMLAARLNRANNQLRALD